jgi:hypothetical protein
MASADVVHNSKDQPPVHVDRDGFFYETGQDGMGVNLSVTAW